VIRQYQDHINRFSLNARLFLIAMSILAFGTAAPTLFFNLYLEQIGFDRAFIGGVNTVIQLGGMVMALPAALLLDRIGRRRAIPIALAIGLISWSLSLLTPSGEVILALQAANGAGTVLFGLAVVPLLAEASTPRERTTLFSVSEGATTLALFFGSVLFGYVPNWVAPFISETTNGADAYRVTLLLSAGLRAIGLLPFLVLRNTPPAAAQSNNPTNNNNNNFPAQTKKLRRYDPRQLLKLQTPIWLCCIPYFLVYCGGSLIFPFLSIFLKERFAASDSAIGFVLGFLNLSIGIGALLGPALVGVLGRSRVVVAGAFASAAALGVIGFAPGFGLVASMVVLRAGLFNLTLPIYKAFVVDRAPVHEYTLVSLILSTSANIGPAISPIISGWLQRQVGFGPVFGLAIALYMLAGLGYLYVFAHLQHKRNSATTRNYSSVYDDEHS
jgi:MFS family permease